MEIPIEAVKDNTAFDIEEARANSKSAARSALGKGAQAVMAAATGYLFYKVGNHAQVHEARELFSIARDLAGVVVVGRTVECAASLMGSVQSRHDHVYNEGRLEGMDALTSSEVSL